MIVTPTYAWRIPRLVRDWLLQTELRGCEAGVVRHDLRQRDRPAPSGITARSAAKKGHRLHGDGADRHARELYRDVRRSAGGRGTRRSSPRAEPDIDRAIAALKAGQPFAPTRNNLYDRFMSGPVNPLFYTFCVKVERLRRRGCLHRLRPLRGALPDEQHHTAGRQTRLGQGAAPTAWPASATVPHRRLNTEKRVSASPAITSRRCNMYNKKHGGSSLLVRQ